MRADARRSRQSILDATIDLVLLIGGAPSRDAVAERAGVGIATLYRHFPDQQRLLRAVAVEILDRVIAEGGAAIGESATGGEALRRYLHAAIDCGLGAVNIVHPLLTDHDWPEQLEEARGLLGRLVAAAARDLAVDDAHTATDIALAAIRFCRPLAVGLDADDDRAIAHQQLDRYLDGLAVHASHPRR